LWLQELHNQKLWKPIQDEFFTTSLAPLIFAICSNAESCGHLHLITYFPSFAVCLLNNALLWPELQTRFFKVKARQHNFYSPKFLSGAVY
jgi:hypothetical protein